MGGAVDFPEVDPDDDREVLGVILHPTAWASLRKTAALLRVVPQGMSRYPILGTSTGVPEGGSLLVYELGPALVQLERDGHPLEPLA